MAAHAGEPHAADRIHGHPAHHAFGNGHVPFPRRGADAGCDDQAAALQGERRHQPHGNGRRHPHPRSRHGVLHRQHQKRADELHRVLLHRCRHHAGGAAHLPAQGAGAAVRGGNARREQKVPPGCGA